MARILDDMEISVGAVAATAAQTEVLTSVYDMAGWDGIVFICYLGDVTISSVLTLTAKCNSANSTSSPTPVAVTDGATTAWTATATDADDKLLVVDVVRPSKRYVFASLTRTAANAVVNGIIAIRYRARSLPVTQPATVIASAKSTPMV